MDTNTLMGLLSNGATAINPKSKVIFTQFNDTVFEVLQYFMMAGGDDADLVGMRATKLRDRVSQEPNYIIHGFSQWLSIQGKDIVQKMVDANDDAIITGLGTPFPVFINVDIMAVWNNIHAKGDVWTKLQNLVTLCGEYDKIERESHSMADQLQDLMGGIAPILPALLQTASESPIFAEMMSAIQGNPDASANFMETISAMMQPQHPEQQPLPELTEDDSSLK